MLGSRAQFSAIWVQQRLNWRHQHFAIICHGQATTADPRRHADNSGVVVSRSRHSQYDRLPACPEFSSQGWVCCITIAIANLLISTIGVLTGVYDLGAVIGSLSCIFYGEKIGRIRTILIGLILGVIALAIESLAFSLAQFIFGRILVGGSIGTISAAVPVWQSECASTVHRGAFVVFEGLCISGGITVPEWISFGLYFATTNSANWRVPIVFPVVFALFALPSCSLCQNLLAG